MKRDSSHIVTVCSRIVSASVGLEGLHRYKYFLYLLYLLMSPKHEIGQQAHDTGGAALMCIYFIIFPQFFL